MAPPMRSMVRNAAVAAMTPMLPSAVPTSFASACNAARRQPGANAERDDANQRAGHAAVPAGQRAATDDHAANDHQRQAQPVAVRPTCRERGDAK